MIRRIFAVFLVMALSFSLTACAFFSKPEDPVNELMKQENLLDLASEISDISVDDEDISSIFWSKIFTSSVIKNLMLENVRSMSYTITDVSANGNRATVTAIITHNDISPVIDRTFSLFIDKLIEMDNSGVQVPENEDELAEWLLSLLMQFLKEAANKARPTETYTKIRFTCEKDYSGAWVLTDIPDDFIEIVMLMNIDFAVQEGFENFDYFG